MTKILMIKTNSNNVCVFCDKKIEAITKTRNLKNTKFFMVFFVVSTFRDFVIKNLFLFRFIRVGSLPCLKI